MKYRELKNYKYELIEEIKVEVQELGGKYVYDYFVTIQNGWVTIRRGYAWDGATGVPDTVAILKASIVHDVLYQCIREGLLDESYKDVADRILKRLCIEYGMSDFMAELVYAGVKMFGKKCVKRKKDGEENEIAYEI